MRTCAVFFGDATKGEIDLLVVYGDHYFTSRNTFLEFLINDLHFTPQMAKTVMLQAFQKSLVERTDIEVILKVKCNMKVADIRKLLSIEPAPQEEAVVATEAKPKRTRKKAEPVAEAPAEEAVKPKRTRKKKTEESVEKPAETPKKKRSTRKKKTDV